MKNTLLLCFAVFAFAIHSFALGPISGLTHACVGSGYIYTNTTPGGVWTVSDVSVATITSGTSGNLNPISAGVVTVTYTVGSTYVTKTVTVNDAPAPISAPTAFCNDVYALPLTDATPGGTWTCSGAAFDSISTSGVLYHLPGCASACGADVITYTLPSGCYKTRSITVNPIVSAYIPPNLCVGTSDYAVGSPAGGTWSSSSPAVASVFSSGIAVGVAPGTVILTYTYLGCQISNWGSPTHVSAGIGDHHVNAVSDTSCTGPDFFVAACGTSTAFNVTTWFGDGTSANTDFSGSTAGHTYHDYALPGTYTVKQVLYSSTTPVDSSVFSYEYLHCKTLPVKIYIDKNHNCSYDAGDIPSFLPVKVRVDSNGIAVDTIPATSGVYYKTAATGTAVYSFHIISVPPSVSVSCPAGGIASFTVVPAVNTYTAQHVGLQTSGSVDFDLGGFSSANAGRHLFKGRLLVNNGYGTSINPVVRIDFSPQYIFQSASPFPTSILGNTATWNFDSVCIEGNHPIIDFSLTRLGSWLTPGDTIHTSIQCSPFVGDVNPTNNTTDRVDTVKSSFDPNEISVSPAGDIAAGTELTYTVVFENTGNDTARNISVLDTLPASLDLHTMQIVASSAQMNTVIIKESGLNIVKFDFPGINLPDSSHHNACTGMVQFSVKTKDALPAGTAIPNRTGIYFDDNEVVMTNTAWNNIAIPSVSVAGAWAKGDIAIFPNPVSDVLTITSASGAYTSATISNGIGQKVVTGAVTQGRTQLDVKMLPAGVYYLQLAGPAGTTTRKFVK